MRPTARGVLEFEDEEEMSVDINLEGSTTFTMVKILYDSIEVSSRLPRNASARHSGARFGACVHVACVRELT